MPILKQPLEMDADELIGGPSDWEGQLGLCSQ